MKPHCIMLAVLLAALPVGCSGANFGEQASRSKKPSTPTATADGDPLIPGANTVYIPLDGSKDLGTPAACAIQDTTIATCNKGVITGNKLGTTTVNGNTKVVVYDPANPPPGIDAGTAIGTNGLTTGETAIVNSLPGVEATEVGINFEDLEDQGDADYNDAVTCFQGNFKVDNTNVVSTSNQTVTAQIHSITGCQDTLRIDVTHLDGTMEPEQIIDAKTTTTITLKFKVGSKLDVYMRTNDKCVDPSHERNMHQGLSTIPDAKVQPNLCNVTGI